MEKLWSAVKAPLYSLSDKEKQLGLGKKGVTKYFTENCGQEDADRVQQYMKHKEIEGYINRVIKTEEGGVPVYEIRHAGVENKVWFCHPRPKSNATAFLLQRYNLWSLK